MSEETPHIADAVLYEGLLLYPYRQSALKNQHRYPFGTLFPPAFCEATLAGDDSWLRLECLMLAADEPAAHARLRFLQLAADVAARPLVRDVRAGARSDASFEFAPITGTLQTFVQRLDAGVWKLAIEVRNQSEPPARALYDRDAALAFALASPHLLLTAEHGRFVSLIDPPQELRASAARCRSHGTWPVLLGQPGEQVSGMLLSAPIILYDHPQIAPESPGDFFDGTEIDELLTLRLLTLSDAEKAEIRAAGGPGRAVLERTEALGIGAAVRLHPSRCADTLDLALDGRLATIRGIERDYEGRTYFAVTLNDDPGRDLGPFGHRFFMRPDEVERA